jgi:hypothetical protein
MNAKRIVRQHASFRDDAIRDYQAGKFGPLP